MARLSTGSLMCGVFVLAGSLTASAAQAPSRTGTRRRGSAATTAEPAGAAERHGSGAGRDNHAELLRRAGRDLQSLPRLQRAWRPDERFRGRHEADEEHRARDDADGARDQSDRAEGGDVESRRPGGPGGLRDVPSRRRDSGRGSRITWRPTATSRDRSGRSAQRRGGTTRRSSSSGSRKVIQLPTPLLPSPKTLGLGGLELG